MKRERDRLWPQAGFTLIELVVFIVVVAVGISGTILAINQSVALAPRTMEQTRAMEIAQAYLDEIITKRFDQNSGQGGLPTCDSPNPGASSNPCSNTLGPEGGESRATFNDVDDYHGINDSPPLDASGAEFASPHYTDFRVQIDVSYAGSEVGLGNNRYAKRISVVVISPFGQSIPVTMYRSNF